MKGGGAARTRIRVVHVSFGLDVGGQEKLLVEFARHADREAFELHFISLGDRGRLADDIEACGWGVTTMNMARGLRPKLLARMAFWMRRWRPDVIHTHDERSLFYSGPTARLLGIRRPRVVHTRHWWRLNHARRTAATQTWLSRLTDRYVGVSNLVYEACRNEGIAPGKLRTILNGIDMNRFEYRGPHPGGPVVSVARLTRIKDIANLVRAMALVVRTIPSARAEVAGDGACLAELQALARELGVADHVTFLGEVRDIPGVLARAGLFVLSSQTEGIPLTLLEAMARGLPVVATRVGGVPEVVVEGETGLMVPPSDSEALAAGIRRVLADPGLGEQLGRAGRRRAEQRFDIRRMVGDYEAEYRELSGWPVAGS